MTQHRLWQRILHRASFFMAMSVRDRTASPNLALIMLNVDSTFDRLWYAFRNSSRLNWKNPYSFSHSVPGSPGTLLLLNGMNGAALWAVISSKFSCAKYPLSADTSERRKPA